MALKIQDLVLLLVVLQIQDPVLHQGHLIVLKIQDHRITLQFNQIKIKILIQKVQIRILQKDKILIKMMKPASKKH
jgi:hypothetical protein